jgi:RNA-directed DNA polymerase
MKESHGEGPATHTGPESCVDARKGGGETLTGERAGRVFSRETHVLRSADAVRRSGRPHPTRRQRKTRRGSARSETPSMCGRTSRENRESLGSPVADGAAGRVGKSKDTRRR